MSQTLAPLDSVKKLPNAKFAVSVVHGIQIIGGLV
jgi:hypothetical protein